MSCPDCLGTGKYRGFTVVEDCRACGVSGAVQRATEAGYTPTEIRHSCGCAVSVVYLFNDDGRVRDLTPGTSYLNPGCCTLRDFSGEAMRIYYTWRGRLPVWKPES